MQAEVIAIGDELTSGQRLDTNSQWLSQRLTELGLRVVYHTTVADDLAANVAAFRVAIDRADLVVCTGGLGPTADDLTRPALAEATAAPLVRDDEVLAHIRALFARRGRTMPERNVVQAMFPRGSRPISNPHGTAPGIDMTIQRPGRGPCRWFAFPGVPVEMYQMWSGSVVAAIRAAQPRARVTCHRRVKCFGVGESQLEAMLPDLVRRGREPQVGITVSQGTITLRVTASGADQATCQNAMQPTLATIHRLLGTLVFGAEDDELQHVVARLLDQCDKTAASAEGATEGLVALKLAEACGPDARFLGGTVLGWPAEILPRHGRAAGSGDPGLAGAGTSAGETSAGAAPRPQSIEDLAQAVRSRTGADYGLAVAPRLGRDQGDRKVPIALATRAGVQAKVVGLADQPSLGKVLLAKQSLNMLRLALLDAAGQGEAG